MKKEMLVWFAVCAFPGFNLLCLLISASGLLLVILMAMTAAQSRANYSLHTKKQRSKGVVATLSLVVIPPVI